ncbi:MAG: sterol desaturase family protein [Elusimicrobia bacterium]|nr:sterol desaturase family protein [Elusimicrobiota bacterium]
MVPRLLIAAAAGCAFAEVYGYWLHILLHSNRIEFLSRDHMLHHLVIYGPRQPLVRPGPYLSSTKGRLGLGAIGLEWLVPVVLAILACLALLRACGAAWPTAAAFVGASLAWSSVFFNYVHDATHIKGIWLEQAPLLRSWFATTRRLHILHHTVLDDEGHMAANFGISFALCDRLFGTFLAAARPFNESGLRAALRRYSYIF